MLLATLIAASTLLASSLAASFSGPYCGNGDIPDTAACQAGMALIDPAKRYGEGTLIWSRDCSISLGSIVLFDHTTITGQEWIDAINNMVGNRCGYYRGWDIVSGTLNASAYKCYTGGGFGVPNRVCNGPEPIFAPGKKRRSVELDIASETLPELVTRDAAIDSTSEPVVKDVSVRQIRRSSQRTRAETPLVRRDLGPEEGYVCGGYIAVKTESCTAIADDLRGKSWNLPFIKGDNNGCYLGVQVKSLFSVDTGMDGDQIADTMVEGMNRCQNQGYIGDVTYNPGVNIAYTTFFGQLCGHFGSGIGDCGNSGGQ